MDDAWTYLEGKRRGRMFMASLRRPFDRTRWPEYDHHVRLVFDYKPHWRDGLPKPAELTRLQDLEDRMIDQPEGHSALVATETGDARRTVHLFVRGGGPLAAMYAEHAAKGKRGSLEVAFARDPEWRGVAHLAALTGEPG